ncbi:MAG: outer membrane protein assembly factor BamE [Gemmobacter sp.]
MAGQAGEGMVRRAGIGVALAFAVALSACTPIIRDHGYVPTDADLSQVVVGVDTRDTVAETVGRPSAQGLLNDQGWFYVRSRFRQLGPREPKEVERQVVAITFDGRGVVSDIGRFGLEDGRVVTLSRRVTDTNVKGFSFIRQLLQNVGRLAPGDI